MVASLAAYNRLLAGGSTAGYISSDEEDEEEHPVLANAHGGAAGGGAAGGGAAAVRGLLRGRGGGASRGASPHERSTTPSLAAGPVAPLASGSAPVLHTVPAARGAPSRGAPSRGPPSTPSAAGQSIAGGEWQCTTCTLMNPPLFLVCSACGSIGPQ
jgi:hypothetical protein